MLQLRPCLLLMLTLTLMLHPHFSSSVLMPVRLNTPPPLAACLDGSHYVITPSLYN